MKNLPTVQETWVRSLGQEDPLEKEMTTHSRILAWEMLWTKEPRGLQSMGSQQVRHSFITKHTYTQHQLENIPNNSKRVTENMTMSLMVMVDYIFGCYYSKNKPL